jgi:hypothetical protein
MMDALSVSIALLLLGFVVWMFYHVVTPPQLYAPNDPRLKQECPTCGHDEITECGHHD